MYKNVRSFQNLLEINVAFLRNEIDETYYYLGPFGDCEDHVDRREFLVDLHQQHNVYTINGQSNVVQSNYVQHSYLEFIVQPHLANKLKDKLLACPEVFTSVSSKESGQVDNFPTDVYHLTYKLNDEKQQMSQTRWFRDNDWSCELDTYYIPSTVKKVLRGCSVFFIVVKDPSTNRETDEVLRDVMIELK